MPFEFGDVVLVPFPFTSQAASKRRPAVVVSSTSQLRPIPALGDVWLRHWQVAGLLKPSAVKPVMATLEQSLIIRKLGSLASEDQDILRQAIGQMIG